MTGAEVHRRERLDSARAEALADTLGCDYEPEAPLIPFGHQVYFWTVVAPGALGRDGHPATGGFLPDLGLKRRMWAGGRLLFAAPIRTGRMAEKSSVVERTERKAGRSGPLAFVTVRHEIRQAGRLCVTEWQDLVYRDDPAPGAPVPMPPVAPDALGDEVRRSFTPTDLFRYSALTFNGHRIHYDADYARTIEGYAGLVVHGPLLAQHLMLIAEGALGALRQFRFRATAPLIAGEDATFCRTGTRFWVRGADGRMCMEAEAG
ncbi:MAG: acyl dehydratase [Rhodobacterales bacterium 32-67-9]|nr:MAG: acyl dehydratase [Rhodobacterales bacterium 32-67-9]